MGKKTLSILIVVLIIAIVTAASASAAKSATNNNSKDTDIGKVNLKTTTATETIGKKGGTIEKRGTIEKSLPPAKGRTIKKSLLPAKGETIEKRLPRAGTTFEGPLRSWVQQNRHRYV